MSDSDYTIEQRREHAYQRHKQAQLSSNAYTLMLPVRVCLRETLKAFGYEARRTGTMQSFVKTLRNVLLWTQVNCGDSDDTILDGIESELDRIRARKDAQDAENAE